MPTGLVTSGESNFGHPSCKRPAVARYQISNILLSRGGREGEGRVSTVPQISGQLLEILILRV